MMPMNHPFLTKLVTTASPIRTGPTLVIFSVTIIGGPNGWTYADQPSDANK